MQADNWSIYHLAAPCSLSRCSSFVVTLLTNWRQIFAFLTSSTFAPSCLCFVFATCLPARFAACRRVHWLRLLFFFFCFFHLHLHLIAAVSSFFPRQRWAARDDSANLTCQITGEEKAVSVSLSLPDCVSVCVCLQSGALFIDTCQEFDWRISISACWELLRVLVVDDQQQSTGCLFCSSTDLPQQQQQQHLIFPLSCPKQLGRITSVSSAAATTVTSSFSLLTFLSHPSSPFFCRWLLLITGAKSQVCSFSANCNCQHVFDLEMQKRKESESDKKCQQDMDGRVTKPFFCWWEEEILNYFFQSKGGN